MSYGAFNLADCLPALEKHSPNYLPKLDCELRNDIHNREGQQLSRAFSKVSLMDNTDAKHR